MDSIYFDYKRGFDGESELHFGHHPIIGISANIMDENSALAFAYSQALVSAGAAPVIIPANIDSAGLHALLGSLDGVLFSGGDDIDARYFGQENMEGLTDVNPYRDYGEFMLLRAAMDRGMPIFGICRGFQLVNIALGGGLYQDLKSCYGAEPLNHSVLTDRHKGVHDISIDRDSLLYRIVGSDTLLVNSRHHQALDGLAPGLRATAYSSDGVVEALEGYPERKIIGVQCHPENMATRGENLPMQRLFSFFTSEAALYRRARALHQRTLTIDSHCDTPMLYESGGFNLASRDPRAKVDIVKMREGYLDATITVAYLPQSTPKEGATAKAFEILGRFKRDVEAYGDKISLALSASELPKIKHEGKRAVMLGVENGLAIGDDLDNIDRLKEIGVVYITLCHNGSNDICDSARGEAIYGGLSPFGRQVVHRMNSLGVTVDISHSSHQTTMEVVRVSERAIIASHSSCKALCDHPRNLSDEAISAIASTGGVVQICGYGGFLALGREATIIDIVEHIEHAVSLVGYDHVGIGSDFDGDGGVCGFDSASEFMNLTIELLRRGHTEEDIAKIIGGNIYRVLIENSRV